MRNREAPFVQQRMNSDLDVLSEVLGGQISSDVSQEAGVKPRRGIRAGDLNLRFVNSKKMVELVQKEDVRRRKGRPRTEPSGAQAFHKQPKEVNL